MSGEDQKRDEEQGSMRKSIEATYDSRETGDRYHVTTRIGDRTIGFRERMPDPFVRQTVTVGWPDLLRGLLRRRLVVEVIVGGDTDVVNDVLELDDNTLIPGSTRRQEFNEHLADAIKFHVAAPPVAAASDLEPSGEG